MKKNVAAWLSTALTMGGGVLAWLASNAEAKEEKARRKNVEERLTALEQQNKKEEEK